MFEIHIEKRWSWLKLNTWVSKPCVSNFHLYGLTRMCLGCQIKYGGCYVQTNSYGLSSQLNYIFDLYL